MSHLIRSKVKFSDRLEALGDMVRISGPPDAALLVRPEHSTSAPDESFLEAVRAYLSDPVRPFPEPRYSGLDLSRQAVLLVYNSGDDAVNVLVLNFAYFLLLLVHSIRV